MFNHMTVNSIKIWKEEDKCKVSKINIRSKRTRKGARKRYHIILRKSGKMVNLEIIYIQDLEL